MEGEMAATGEESRNRRLSGARGAGACAAPRGGAVPPDV